MGHYSSLTFVPKLFGSLRARELYQAKNHLSEAWGLFFTSDDFAELEGRPVLQAPVARALTRADQVRAALAPLCTPVLARGVEAFIDDVRSRGSGTLRVDPAELVGLTGAADARAMLKELVATFAALEPKKLRKRLLNLESLGEDDDELLDGDLEEFFGSPPGGTPEWMRTPVPPPPASDAAAADRFFQLLGVPVPKPVENHYRQTVGDWAVDLSFTGGAWFLFACPPKEAKKNIPMAGIRFQIATPAHLDAWGRVLGAHRARLKMPEQYILWWHECEGAEALREGFEPFEAERDRYCAGVVERLSHQLAEAPAAGTPKRIGLGRTTLVYSRIAAAPPAPERLSLTIEATPGALDWALDPPALMTNEHQRLAAAALLDQRLAQGLQLEKNIKLFTDRVELPLTAVYALHNTPELRKFALYLLDLPDDDARRRAVFG